MLTKEMLAAQLNGSEYPFRPTAFQESQIKAAGLVVVYGASDDLMEFCGCISDEVGAYEGTTAKVDKDGVFTSWDDLCHRGDMEEAQAEEYFRRKPNVRGIKAIWDRDGYSWQYETDIPHATFDIMEDGETYCRGIVFSFDDLNPAITA